MVMEEMNAVDAPDVADIVNAISIAVLVIGLLL